MWRLTLPSPNCSLSIQRTIAFLIALIGMAVSGSLYAFSVFAPAFKKTFRYDQSKVETISAFGNIGTCLGFPIGMFFNRFGPKWTASLGLIVYSPAYLLIWMTLQFKDYFSIAYGWQCLFFFIVGQGSTIIYMACLMTSINNYPFHLRGTIIGLLDSLYGGSAAIFSGIYAGAFINGHNKGDEEKQNLKGYFCMCAIVIGVICSLAIMFLKLLPQTDRSSTLNIQEDDNCSNASADEDHHNETISSYIIGEKGGFSILIDIDFQYLFWIANIGGGISLMYMNNVSSILESFHMMQYNSFLSTLTPVAGCVARVISGYASDRLAYKLPRIAILLFWLVLLAVMQLISMFFLNNYAVLVLNSIFIGSAMGSVWCLTPTIVSELFGTKHFGWNWGWMMISTAMGTAIYQRIFAAIYQFYIRPGDGLTCYGIKCYRWTMLFTSVTALFSIILSVGLLQRINRVLKRRKVIRANTEYSDQTSSHGDEQTQPEL